MTPTIWHNPRCTKSRQTLALLEERSLNPVVVKYLETAPSVAQITQALKLLGIPAIMLVRTGEPIFKELGLAKSDSDDVLIAAMAANPKLIERPVVFANNRAAIGRPPEAVLDIL